MPESENVILRRELGRALNRIDQLEIMNKTMLKEITMLKTRLALYESPNMPTSQPSLYNYDRKEFRKRRGEDISGSPGDKAKGDTGR